MGGNWFEFFMKTLPTILEVAAAGIVFVLHSTGADKHKTIAGEIASGLTKAATAATAAHDALNGLDHNPPPGGGP